MRPCTARRRDSITTLPASLRFVALPSAGVLLAPLLEAPAATRGLENAPALSRGTESSSGAIQGASEGTQLRDAPSTPPRVANPSAQPACMARSGALLLLAALCCCATPRADAAGAAQSVSGAEGVQCSPCRLRNGHVFAACYCSCNSRWLQPQRATPATDMQDGLFIVYMDEGTLQTESGAPVRQGGGARPMRCRCMPSMHIAQQ